MITMRRRTFLSRCANLGLVLPLSPSLLWMGCATSNNHAGDLRPRFDGDVIIVGAGAAGLVCSAKEVGDLRARFPDAVLVTPGIRPEGYGKQDDQTRVVTPADALAAGSSYLVIGRPIYQAEDPRQAAEEIARSLF